MIEIIDELQALLEPDGSVALDPTAAQPFDFVANTLYGWEESSAQRNLETGPVVREDFTLLFVYVVDNEQEEADQRRSRDVSLKLDERRARYLDTIRTHQHGGSWDNIVGASVPDMVRQFEIRGIAVRVMGYRILA